MSLLGVSDRFQGLTYNSLCVPDVAGSWVMSNNGTGLVPNVCVFLCQPPVAEVAAAAAVPESACAEPPSSEVSSVVRQVAASSPATGTPFQGYCRRCRRFGHKAKDCKVPKKEAAQVRREAPVRSGPPANSAGKGNAEGRYHPYGKGYQSSGSSWSSNSWQNHSQRIDNAQPSPREVSIRVSLWTRNTPPCPQEHP